MLVSFRAMPRRNLFSVPLHATKTIAINIVSDAFQIAYLPLWISQSLACIR